MEIKSDFMDIIGILANAKAAFGDLSEVSKTGLQGDVEKTACVLDSLKTFLKNKNLLDDNNIPNPDYKDEFKQICFILMVNVKFSTPFEIEEYSRLTFNVPKISKYLLTVVVVELQLVKYYCSAVRTLPLIFSRELFNDFSTAVENLKLKAYSENICYLLKAIVNIIVQNRDQQHSEEMDDLEKCLPFFFFSLANTAAQRLSKTKSTIVFKRIGLVIRKLFKLLDFCHSNNLLYGVFIDRLIDATTSILRGISIEVFIYWAEVDLKSGDNLQTEIAEASYNLRIKYLQLHSASDMVKAMEQFALKPKTLKQKIGLADVDKMIFMINKADENQAHWFGALIFSDFSSNENAIKCIERWSHLCKGEGVLHLLSKPHDTSKILALKCTADLELSVLIEVVSRHFLTKGFSVMGDVQTEIIQLFNTLQVTKQVEDGFMKKLLLLILKNAEFCIHYILTECIKSSFFSVALKECFSTLRNIFNVRCIGLNGLQQVMKETPPSPENFETYVKMFQMFLDLELIYMDSLTTEIISPIITENNVENLEKIKEILSIFNALNIQIPLTEEMETFLENIFDLLKLRTQFINHRSLNQVIISEVANLLEHKVQHVQTDLNVMVAKPDDDKFVVYYKKCLSDPRERQSLLQHICKDWTLENRTKSICQLMQVLPSCVTREWIKICLEIEQQTSCEELLTVLNDMMLLLCEFIQSQENSENYQNLLMALKYCVNQIGLVIQETILLNNTFIENEITSTKALVELMAILPATIKESESMILMSLMTERSLKFLGKDKKFVTKICKINNKNICQILAQKILN